MKVQVILPVSLVLSVALLGVLKIRKKESDRELKKEDFENVKLRVTNDVLGEYKRELAETENRVETAQTEMTGLEKETNELRFKVTKTQTDFGSCDSARKTAQDGLAAVESQMNNLKAETEKEESGWKTEVDTLKSQLAARSAVCDHLKKDAHVGNLCEAKAAPKEEPKAESPQAETPKPDEPKAEEAKAEAPKAEEAKAEEAKAEAPKAEEAKAEAPKAEEAKAEAPKAEEAKAEAPKAEEAKAEAPKAEEAKAEAPKAEEAKAEAPKGEEAKA
ncbi:uncharacterized protein AB9X84_023705 [Acanthopagrus schlegelii]